MYRVQQGMDLCIGKWGDGCEMVVKTLCRKLSLSKHTTSRQIFTGGTYQLTCVPSLSGMFQLHTECTFQLYVSTSVCTLRCDVTQMTHLKRTTQPRCIVETYHSVSDTLVTREKSDKVHSVS